MIRPAHERSWPTVNGADFANCARHEVKIIQTVGVQTGHQLLSALGRLHRVAVKVVMRIARGIRVERLLIELDRARVSGNAGWVV